MGTTVLLIIIFLLVFVLLFTPVYSKEVQDVQKPYLFYVQNNNSEKSKAVLWGYNRYILSPNLGSDAYIDIKCDAGITYFQNVTQSNSNPFSIRKTVVFGMLKDLLDLTINVVSVDANGSGVTIPVSVGKSISDENKLKKPDEYITAQISFMIPIDGKTNIEFDVNPNSKIDFAFQYSVEKFVKSNYFLILYNRVDSKMSIR